MLKAVSVSPAINSKEQVLRKRLQKYEGCIMKFNKWSLDIFKRMTFTRKKREKDYLKKGFEVQKKVFNIVESSKDIIYCYESNPSSKFRYLSPSINTLLGQGVLEEAYNDPSSPSSIIDSSSII